MVKSKDNEAVRQRIIRRKKKKVFDKLKAFYVYVLTHHPDIIRSFEVKQSDETQDEAMASYIHNFDTTLLE